MEVYIRLINSQLFTNCKYPNVPRLQNVRSFALTSGRHVGWKNFPKQSEHILQNLPSFMSIWPAIGAEKLDRPISLHKTPPSESRLSNLSLLALDSCSSRSEWVSIFNTNETIEIIPGCRK